MLLKLNKKLDSSIKHRNRTMMKESICQAADTELKWCLVLINILTELNTRVDDNNNDNSNNNDNNNKKL